VRSRSPRGRGGRNGYQDDPNPVKKKNWIQDSEKGDDAQTKEFDRPAINCKEAEKLSQKHLSLPHNTRKLVTPEAWKMIQCPFGAACRHKASCTKGSYDKSHRNIAKTHFNSSSPEESFRAMEEALRKESTDLWKKDTDRTELKQIIQSLQRGSQRGPRADGH
jgi:hypothetical protein